MIIHYAKLFQGFSKFFFQKYSLCAKYNFCLLKPTFIFFFSTFYFFGKVLIQQVDLEIFDFYF